MVGRRYYDIRRERKEDGQCVTCGKVLDRRGRYCIACVARANEYSRKNSIQLKNRVYSKYGNMCACCGETEPTFLTIDHINGRGRSQRNYYGVVSGKGLYLMIVKEGFPDKYQILCRNCNYGKYANDGVCPHKEQRDTTTRQAKDTHAK